MLCRKRKLITVTIDQPRFAFIIMRQLNTDKAKIIWGIWGMMGNPGSEINLRKT